MISRALARAEENGQDPDPRTKDAKRLWRPADMTEPPAAARVAGTGERHRQGCYADLDGLLSTLAVLRRVRSRP